MALISSTPRIKYDVFLSFRGYDTRNTFTSHLCKALHDKQIETFIDDKLNRGDEISPSLLSTIEESHISIVIFSKNYASSRWCLEELAKIVECRENQNQIVIPVFYEIDPTDVRNQTGSYAEAFAQHEQRLDKVQRVQTWKGALKQAANLSGFHSREIKPESVLVNKIVDHVLKKLENMSPSYNSNLPGMNSRIKQIESLLRRGDVRSLGIWGIGGIGKTTLAQEVSKKISCQFESSGFAGSVREHSKQGRLDSLRKDLLSTLLKDENAYMGTFIEKRLGRKKLLIILDDVTDFRDIKHLIGDPADCLASESLLIVTSRDKQVLQNCSVHHIYHVDELCFNDALNLFCQHAFRQNHPKVDYKEQSNSVVEAVGGVPLALEVLGSALLSSTKNVWESTLKKLENIFDKKIHEVLKISYDELDDSEQSLFLDIACFFKGSNIDTVKMIMDDCGSFDVEIRDLIGKSLITESRNMLTMHDLLQEMGKEIVRQESTKDPSKRTRLWRHKDICDVLSKDKGTEMIETIYLNMSSPIAKDINLSPCAFAKMKKLRLLKLICGNKVHVLEDLVESDFTELKYFHWDGYPLKSLQSKFRFENLVILELRDSNIEELWGEGVQALHNLKSIDLRGSQHLISCPGLLMAPNLESLCLSHCKSLESIPDCTHLESVKKLDFEECSKLKRLPPLPINLETIGLDYCTSLAEIQSSFTHLHKLRSLILVTGYESLTSIADLRGLKSLTQLAISYCPKLKMLPELPHFIEELTLEDVPIEEFPPSSEDLESLRFLHLRNCSMLKSLPSSVRKWKFLYECKLENCPKIDKLPDDIGALKSLRIFKAEGTAIGEVPSSISCLKRLGFIYMSRCEGVDGVGLLLPPNLLGLENLFYLTLSDCGITKLPDSFGDLTSLHELDLKRNNFVSIPGSIINLSKLESLDISHCKRLRELPQLPAGTRILDISYCERIREVPQLPAGGDKYIAAVNCTSLERSSYFAFQNDIFEKPSILEAYFINCCNLDQVALNDVVKDTLLKIQGQAALVKKDTPRLYDDTLPISPFHFEQAKASKRVWLPASIIYPESKIPEWFEYQQSRGSFIDVKLPPLWLNCNVLCFALCVVVAIPNPDRQCNHPKSGDHRSSKVTFDCYVKSKDGNRHVLKSNLFGYHWTYRSSGMPYCGPNYMKSNHVIIGFGYYFFREFCDNEFSFQFNVENVSKDDKEDFKVEMCGVHLMSGLHLETSDESKEKDEPHLEESYEEDEPHPKRLKHIE